LTRLFQLEGDEFNGSATGTPKIIPFPETISRIAVGRRSCLALSETGSLYVVDVDFNYSAIITISSKDILQELPTQDHAVQHMAAGWQFAAAVFKDIGLMVWKPDVSETDRSSLRHNSFLPGYIMQRNCNARRITRLEDVDDPEIIGLMVGDGFLVYLTKGGFVYRVNISEESFTTSSPVESFRLEHFVTTPKLSYISGSFNHFGVFNTAGDVLVGNAMTMADTNPTINPALQRLGIIGLSWGDWHALALCENGEVLSWGRELRGNGSLGMGYVDLQEATAMGLHVDGREVSNPEPRKVTGFDEDKFAFCVAAAGWHSAALVADFKVQEPRRKEW
jgi:SCF-associated factor 1